MKLTDKMLALTHRNGNSIFSRTPFLTEGTDDCVMTGFTITINNNLGRSDKIAMAVAELRNRKEEMIVMYDAIIKTLEEHQCEIVKAPNVVEFDFTKRRLK